MNAAASLAQDQQTLLRAVLGGQDDDALQALIFSNACGLTDTRSTLAHRGLQAYRSHGLALAERALSAAYPVIAQMMGDVNFPALAQHFWREQPPLCGDMAQWGSAFPAFLAAARQLVHEPYLADVARVEWALHRATFAADSSVDLASFALLSAEPPAAPSLQLSPGTWLLESAFPVVSLIQAHNVPAEEQDAALAQAASLLASGAQENALVWRDGFKPRLRRIDAAEYRLLAALQAGHSLESALAQVGHPSDLCGHSPFSFADWLAHAVQGGLVTRAFLTNTVTANLI